MSKLDCGYLYVAAGQKYIDEALLSAASLKRLDSASHITLVADRDVKSKDVDNVIVRPINVEDVGKDSNYGGK